jgi:hypothetical protein
MANELPSNEPIGRFRAHGTFCVPARGEFTVWGTVLEGEIRPGMRLALDLGNILCTLTVYAIDPVEIDGEAFVAVRTVEGSDALDREVIHSLGLGRGGEEMKVLPP